MTTSYSGMGTGEVAANDIAEEYGKTDNLECYSACDSDALARKALLGLAHGPSHVFKNLMHWVDAQTQRNLRKMHKQEHLKLTRAIAALGPGDSKGARGYLPSSRFGNSVQLQVC